MDVIFNLRFGYVSFGLKASKTLKIVSETEMLKLREHTAFNIFGCVANLI